MWHPCQINKILTHMDQPCAQQADEQADTLINSEYLACVPDYCTASYCKSEL